MTCQWAYCLHGVMGLLLKNKNHFKKKVHNIIDLAIIVINYILFYYILHFISSYLTSIRISFTVAEGLKYNKQ